jgi:hypothetical protein
LNTETVVLYRPVDANELDLIRLSGWRLFPPRLPGQDFFYPVVQRDYAVRIARDWNAKVSGAGFVTRFVVDGQYLSQFEEHSVGGNQFTEYWVPSTRLAEFNDHIHGIIEMIEEFRERTVLPSGDWVKVYDLEEDRETVKLVQRATLGTEDFGLEPEVALYGTKEWWGAIEKGLIPQHEVTGVISRNFVSGHGDWPEFELVSGLEKSRWTRVGDQSLYKVGMHVRVEYVIQKRRNSISEQREQKEVLRIFVKP